jgi:signal transduction histidine kinase/DNA-binding NarL/FixJ family response regulator
LLVVPFALQIVAAIGLTGYFSMRNGERAVRELSIELREKISTSISQNLDCYLNLPHQIDRANANAISEELLDLNDRERLGRYFYQQMQIFPKFDYINFGGVDGSFTGVYRKSADELLLEVVKPEAPNRLFTYTIDKKGNRENLVSTVDYFFERENWYRDAIIAKRPTWSSIYNWQNDPSILSISASHPIYDRDRKLIGTIGINILLSRLAEFLQQTQIRPSAKIFILERDGRLVAASKGEKYYNLVGKVAQQIEGRKSENETIRETTQSLFDRFGSLHSIQQSQQLDLEIEGKTTFVRVTPWRDNYGLDWLIVVTLPEAEFIAKTEENNRTTVLLCIAALVTTTILGLYTSRWVVRPILESIEAAEQIAKGNWQQEVKISDVKEIGLLGAAFNSMSRQLRESFSALAKNKEQLEARVTWRTLELEKAKEKAEFASKAKTDFLSNMSHELRTPLNGILGYAQILLRDRQLTSRQSDGLETIYQSGQHLLTLINDILDLAKIEARKIELNPNEFHFLEFLDNIVSIVKPQALDKDIIFHYEVRGNIPDVVKTDEKRLRQILLNLLGNAIKFTDRGNVIFRVIELDGFSVSDNYYSRRFRFEVTDTGVGIASENFAKIFLPFEQAVDRSSRSAGTGLGLSICSQLVELMGGKLRVESILGKGSYFWFEVDLPTIEIASATQSRTKARIKGYQGKPRKILVVDDVKVNRLVLLYLLEELGFEVISGENGQEEIDLALSHHPDLILTDIVMPIKNGLEAVREIRQIPELQNVPVIAISADAADLNQQKCNIAGCQAFLSKPFQEENLLSLIREYLQLEWIYEEEIITLDNFFAPETIDSEESLAIPPLEELQTLYELAMLGSMRKIIARSVYLEELDPKYIPFARNLRNLAHDFQEKAILASIERHLSPDNPKSLV